MWLLVACKIWLVGESTGRRCEWMCSEGCQHCAAVQECLSCWRVIHNWKQDWMVKTLGAWTIWMWNDQACLSGSSEIVCPLLCGCLTLCIASLLSVRHIPVVWDFISGNAYVFLVSLVGVFFFLFLQFRLNSFNWSLRKSRTVVQVWFKNMLGVEMQLRYLNLLYSALQQCKGKQFGFKGYCNLEL